MTSTEPQTLAAFIAKHTLTHTVEETTPTLRELEHWGEKNDRGRYFKVLIRKDKKRLTVRFYTGGGQEPTLPDVLDCLASDSVSVENNDSFDKWADEFGIDTSNDTNLGAYRKAKRTYKACVSQAKRLVSFLGDDLYKELLWETGRE